MYNVDWSNLLTGLIPPRLYQTKVVAWLTVLIQSVETTYNSFIDYSDEISYDLAHNSQVVYLRSVLNDTFDPIDKGITIYDAGGASAILLYEDGDEKEVSLQLDSDEDNALILQPDSGYDGGEYDFIVNVPFSLTTGELYQMQALLDKYKLASKRYDIRTE